MADPTPEQQLFYAQMKAAADALAEKTAAYQAASQSLVDARAQVAIAYEAELATVTANIQPTVDAALAELEAAKVAWAAFVEVVE